MHFHLGHDNIHGVRVIDVVGTLLCSAECGSLLSDPIEVHDNQLSRLELRGVQEVTFLSHGDPILSCFPDALYSTSRYSMCLVRKSVRIG